MSAGLSAFLDMGGYAAFVWPSYLVGVAVLVWNAWSARAAHRKALADALRRVERDVGQGEARVQWSREGASQ